MIKPAHFRRTSQRARRAILRLAPGRATASLRPTVGKFLREDCGGVLMTFGLALIPMILAVGITIDLGRAYSVRARLAYALDAAGLAVGASQGNNAELQQIMLSYFNANYPETEIGVPATPVMTITNDVIQLSATVDMPTTFMAVVGIDQLTVATDNAIVKETTGFEVALVLDNTGSMRAGGQMDALKDAAQEMIDIVYGNEQTLEDVWFSVVPYTATVNIGIQHTDWLEPSDQYFDSPSPFEPTAWKGCVEARPGTLDQDDTPPTNDPFDTFLYQSDSDNVWTPIDESNGAQNDGTGPNLGCGPAITPLVAERATIEAAIAEMLPWSRGGTTGNLGLSWGWRALSPQWRDLWGGDTPATHPLDYNEDNMEKVVVMMTDGQNQFYDWPGNGGSGPQGSDYTAYGRLNDFGYPSLSAARDEIDSRFAQTCQDMKAEGIVIFTITFGSALDQQTQDLYQACATTPDHYFHAPSNSKISDVFRSIGTELSNLRIAS